MTVPKPTLTNYTPGLAAGDKPTNAAWNSLLQEGARTQLLIEPVTAFPLSPATTDWCNRNDLNALFQCTNATGPVWTQMSIGSFTTAARPAAPPTNFVYFDTTTATFNEWNGAAYVVVGGSGGGTASAFGAYNSSTQTFTTGTQAQVLFPSAAYNVGSNYTAASSLYTAPAAGQYLVTGSIAVTNSGSTNYFVILASVNNTNAAYFTGLVLGVSAQVQDVPFAGFLNLASGDVVKVFAQAIGATITTTAGAVNTYWNMAQVGAGPQGATGATGPTGPTGPAGLTARGNWAVGTTYAANDWVFYPTTGSSYYSLAAGNVGHTPPAAGTSDANWGALSQIGATGSAGAAGAGLTWRGAWSSVTAYAINDAVFSAGSSWIALTAGTNQALPAAGASNANWSAFSQAGATGTWAHGSSFPGSPALNDPYFRDDLRAQFQCTNATGPVWTQVSYGAFTNATKPAAATYTNLRIFVTDLVQVQESDGTNWHVLSGIEYELLGGCTGKPTSGQIVCHFKTNQPWTLPANMAGSQGDVGTNGTTGSATVQFKKNGSNITNATLVWPAATAAPTLGTNAATAFAQGDILTATITPDSGATLADMTFTLSGVR